MKKYFLLLPSLFSLLFSHALFSEIIENKHFKEITKHVAPDTLIILDIDDTLLLPAQALGADTWFCNRLKENMQIMKQKEALLITISEWEAVRKLTQVKLVEEGTDQIVKWLQDQNFVVMGLTTQGIGLSVHTPFQLRSLNIDLSLTAPKSTNSDEGDYWINRNGVLFHQGILFTGGTKKGAALVSLLDQLGYQPKRVLFINDKLTHLLDLESDLVKRGIEFIGLRYSYNDERVNYYTNDIADYQWKYSSFERFLSDEDAQIALESMQ